MAKILEQDDIDKLFSGEILETPVEQKDEVKVYDFKHPDRLSKEQNRMLHSLMENFCRFTATFLSAATRSLIEMNVSSIDQLTYNEYMFSINEPVALYIVRFRELGGRAIFEFATRFILFQVDRTLGGNGKMYDEDRILTSIEQRVSLNSVEKIFSNFASVWKEVFPFTSNFESFESNPRLVQIAPPGESVILISINISVDGENTLFNICIPFIIIQPPLRNLASRSWNIDVKDDQKTRQYRKKIRERIIKVKTGITCILGEKKIKLKELLDLEVGDTIRLDQKNDNPLILKIGEREKYFVEPGILGERKAVKIMQEIK